MKLMITGAGGLLGGEFAAHLPGRGHEAVALPRAALDVTDADATARALDEHRPDAVLHCAAFAHVDGCEAEPDRAYRINRDAAANVARAAHAAGARVAHFSTDYVFDGAQRTPYAATAPRNPLNTYARSKAEGEDAVLEAAPDALVVRVSWLYGGAAGFVRYVVDSARQGRPLRMVADQTGCPTWTVNVVDIVVALLEREAPAGIWHVSDVGETSRLEQAHETLRVAGLEAEVAETTRAALWPDVPRPPYSVLDPAATEAFLGRPLEPWRDALRRYLGS